MFAAFASRVDPERPLTGLRLGECPEPTVPSGWTTVTVKAASLNHHDLWSLRGAGRLEGRLPMILGCDAAGLAEDGSAVIVHAVLSDPAWTGDETMDPSRSLLSELHQGTFAEKVVVPRRNLIPKPEELSFEEAACLPTAWLTAYRMLFTRGRVVPGQSVLVQGAGGGVATALVVLAAAAGARIYVTGRSPATRAHAEALGANVTLHVGERLPERVDLVADTVGGATWEHSLKSLKPGGMLVVSGVTTGDPRVPDLSRIFLRQISVVGSTMGTRDELERLVRLCVDHGIRPVIQMTMPLREARRGFETMLEGGVRGKIVFTV